MSIQKYSSILSFSVVATMRTAAALNLPINIHGVIPLCENMPSGMAFKPGDVLKTQNGKNVAVHDTDNASHLMMLDAFLYGQQVCSFAVDIVHFL